MSTILTAEKFIAIDSSPTRSTSRLTEYHTPTCADCKHFRPYYLKQSNGSYRAVAWAGACSKSKHTLDNLQSMTFAEIHRPSCENFEPTTTEGYTRVWIKTPAN